MSSSDQVGEISEVEGKVESYGNWLAGWAALSNITLEQIELASQIDKTQQQLIQLLNTNGARNVRSLPPELSEYRNVIRELDVTDKNLLLRGQRLVIPRTLRARFIQQTHVDHRGQMKINALMRSSAWWPGIDRQVENTVQACRECQGSGSLEFTEAPTDAYRSERGET